MIYKTKDSKLSSRLLQTMSRIKNMDTTSARGERNVAIGISTPEGKLQLKGFDFNANAPLKGVFFAPYTLNTSTGEIAISNFIPLEQLNYPQGATHISLQSAVVHLDFATTESEIAYSSIINLPMDLTMASQTLLPSSVPTGSGVQLYLFMISFYQEVNSVQYSLKNEEYNVLNIINIA